MINELCKQAHEAAVEKGFYERKRELPELLMLVVSELSEAMEAERKGRDVDPQSQELAQIYANGYESSDDNYRLDFYHEMRGGIEEEIADAFIRLFDICGYYGIDAEAWITAKMKYNRLRPRMHGKKY